MPVLVTAVVVLSLRITRLTSLASLLAVKSGLDAAGT